MGDFAVAVSSATAMGCAVAGLIFLRHWRATRDRLFAYFAASFWLMAVNRVALVIVGEVHEASTYIYLVRFAAFLLIIVGIVEKNVGPLGRKAP
jgi:Fe2+ transport system protein B